MTDASLEAGVTTPPGADPVTPRMDGARRAAKANTVAGGSPRTPWTGTGLANALRQWAAAVGAEHVLAGDALEKYARTTSPRGTCPLAVVRPGSTAEVQAVVRVANEARFALYPISRGRNWGYGDRSAVTDGQVIVDLGRINRILHVDPELAVAVVEPGVTQGQLAAYLADHGLPLCMDATGAGPDASVVGNIVERGIGHSSYGDRFAQVAGLDVVLADGELLRTGFGHYHNARARYVYPYGVGPCMDGLFTQSNLGIVTRVGVWLQRKPKRVDFFLCSVEKEEDLGPVVDALRELRLSGVLRTVAHVGNDLRVISGSCTFPRHRQSEGTCLSPELRRELREQVGMGAWTVSAALEGVPQVVRAARTAVRRALKGRGRKLIFISERKLRRAEVVARLFRGLPWARTLDHRLRVARALMDLNTGKPNRKFFAGCYWRHRGGMPEDLLDHADPARDGCGMLWFSTVLPMTGRHAQHCEALLSKVFATHHFDPFITFLTVNDRALVGIATIAYDKEDAAETAQAAACYEALHEASAAAGYFPYRTGPDGMRLLADGSNGFWTVVARLKQALDPKGILAPGRYEPSALRVGL